MTFTTVFNITTACTSYEGFRVRGSEWGRYRVVVGFLLVWFCVWGFFFFLIILKRFLNT